MFQMLPLDYLGFFNGCYFPILGFYAFNNSIILMSIVIRRKEKRYVDLAASRGELIEVSIEAVFEPMVQGYIIFPSIISIIQRLAESVKVLDDGTVKVFIIK